MKLAFVSNNGTTISRHFGRARQYVVVTIAEGREVAREVRAKTDCHDHHHDATDAHHPAPEHAQDHHTAMLDAIADCAVLITGGMGAAMDQRLRTAGLRTIRTPITEIDVALKAFLAGQLSDMIALVH